MPGARIVALLLLIASMLGSCVADPQQATWPQPPADRPVVELTFRLADDLASASGSERVTFTPDAQVCELVFRAWPNKPATARSGNRLTVESVAVGGAALPLEVQAAGAPHGVPGTLVIATLPACVPAGRPVTADLAFALRLGDRTDERVGRSPERRVAWLGSAYPMLAWNRGVGWTRDPAVDVVGESATSEAFRLRSLTVEAPDGDRVAGMGEPGATRPGSREGTTAHTFSSEVVRDVSVVVGRIDLHTGTAGDAQLTVALPSGARASAQVWRDQVARHLDELSRLLGPVPATHVWITVLPDVSEGVEFGESVQIADIDPASPRQRWLVAHELAHLWFYGLVGNNQAQHPWLDESFATWAQQVVSPADTTDDVGDGPVGGSMQHWAQVPDPDSAYVASVYALGGQTLLEGRNAVGAQSFDAAIRGYLHRNAWRIATPADLSAALTPVPDAAGHLEEAGAFRD